MDNLDEVTEGEVVANFFSMAGNLCKAFFVWAWNIEGDDLSEYILGALFITLVAFIGAVVIGLLILLFWATVNVDWKWGFLIVPAICLAAIAETRVVKGIVALYREFF